MNISAELLAAYMEEVIRWRDALEDDKDNDAFDARMMSCMLLDRAAGDLMDSSATQERRSEIFKIYSAAKQHVQAQRAPSSA